MNLSRILGLGGIVACALSASASAGGADLSAKYKPGDELYYTTRADVEQTMIPPSEGGGQEMHMTVKTDGGMRFRVLSANPDGSLVMEWTMLYMAMKMGGPMPIDFDSRDAAKQGPPMGPMLKSMINKPATVTVGADGKVKDLKGFDPKSLGPMEGFGQMFSKTGFEQFGLFPTAGAPNPADVGAKWTHTFEMVMPQGMGTMIQETSYAITKLDGAKSADIAYTGQPTMKASAEDKEQPPMMTIKSGNSTGTIHWDVAAGRLDSSESQGDMDMSMQGPMGSMSMKQKTRATISRSTLADFKLPPEKAATSQPAAK